MKKNLLLKIVFSFVCVMALQISLYAQDKQEIVFVYTPATIDATTGENPDVPMMKLFEEQGYTVHRFPIRDITTATAEAIDSLNNADLVYIGRAVTSGNFDPGKKELWNAVTAPMMTSSGWALRNTKMNWFNTADCSNIDDAVGTIFTGDILLEDPVFEGLTGTVDWWDGPYSTINTTDAGNGTVLASKSDNQFILFARFDADTEFYSGSVDMPAGKRTFFGGSSDNMMIDGNKFYNYLGYTDPVKQAFLNEVANIMGVFVSVKDHALNLNVSVYPIPAKDQIIVEMENLNKVDMIDLSGRKVASFEAKAEKAVMNTSKLNKGVYLLKISNSKGETLVKKITKN